MTTWSLAVDFGTTFSCAAVVGDRGASAIEVQNERRVPSAVMLAADGTLLAGTPALYQLALHPDRVERTPKRHLGKPSLLLAGTAVPVPRAVGAVLSLFYEEGRRLRGGAAPARVALTHPAGWNGSAGPRTGALREAAHVAGMPVVDFVPEPVAAAVHYVDDRLRPGEHVAVYDLGGGTFDTAVLRKTDDGFELVGQPGGDDRIGGEELDHRVYRFAGDRLAENDEALWLQIRTGDERRWQQARADLRTRARLAKEQLSGHASAPIYVPEADREITITRDEFEEMIHDDIAGTVDELERTVRDADVATADVAAVYLVGGSSRIPLVARLMTGRFGDRVTTWDEPKTVVALGAAKLLHRSTVTGSHSRTGQGFFAKQAPTSSGATGCDTGSFSWPRPTANTRRPADQATASQHSASGHHRPEGPRSAGFFGGTATSGPQVTPTPPTTLPPPGLPDSPPPEDDRSAGPGLRRIGTVVGLGLFAVLAVALLSQGVGGAIGGGLIGGLVAVLVAAVRGIACWARGRGTGGQP